MKSSLSLVCILIFLVSSQHHQEAEIPQDPPQPDPNSPKEEKEAPVVSAPIESTSSKDDEPNDKDEEKSQPELETDAEGNNPSGPEPLEGAIWDSLVNPQPGQFGSPIETIEEPQSSAPETPDSNTEEETLISPSGHVPVPEPIEAEQSKSGDTLPSGPETQTQTQPPLPPGPSKIIPNNSDSIPSFSEWTQLQLSQKEQESNSNTQSPKNKTTLQNQIQQNQEGKNFASPKCNGKLLNFNQESHNPLGVLSSSLDDYMLNRCKDEIWFIIELCERVKIERISIGNLELFSSNPKEFEFGISDRYPTRDWKLLGPFIAPDQRALHSFDFPANQTFVKYVKVVVKEHYGKEHYCPLSLIKVFGKSEYDDLEAEAAQHADNEAEILRAATAEEEKEKLAKNANSPDATKNSIIGSATEVVIDIVKKAAGALVNKKGNVDLIPDENLKKFNTGNVSGNCITLAQCLPDSIELRDKVIENLSCHRQLLSWLQVHLPWMEWSLDCHQLLQNNSFGSVSTFEGFLVAVYGETMMRSLCHFVRPVMTCPENELMDSNLVQLTSGQPNLTSEGESNENLVGANAPVPQANGNGSSQPNSPAGSIPNGVNVAQEPQQTFLFEDSVPSNTKESIFVRVTNRIKNLEKNFSLTTGYLEELSRRFRKQSETTNFEHELFRITLTDGFNSVRRKDDLIWKEFRRLNRKIDNLRELMNEFELQRSGLILLAFFQFGWILWLFWGIKRDHKLILKQQAIANNSSNSSYDSLQRKRSNPETIRKVKRKRKKKDVQTSTTPLIIEQQQQQPIFPVLTNTNYSVDFKIPSPTVTVPSPLPVFNNLNPSVAEKVGNESDASTSEQFSSSFNIAYSSSLPPIENGFGNYRPNTPTKRKSNKFKSFFNFRQ